MRHTADEMAAVALRARRERHTDAQHDRALAAAIRARAEQGHRSLTWALDMVRAPLVREWIRSHPGYRFLYDSTSLEESGEVVLYW